MASRCRPGYRHKGTAGARSCTCSGKPVAPWPPRTPPAWSTATSSPRTFSWVPAVASASRISVSPRATDASSGLATARPGAPAPAHTATPKWSDTPRYMAPEQLAGEPTHPGSDQFNFCVVHRDLRTPSLRCGPGDPVGAGRGSRAGRGAGTQRGACRSRRDPCRSPSGSRGTSRRTPRFDERPRRRARTRDAQGLVHATRAASCHRRGWRRRDGHRLGDRLAHRHRSELRRWSCRPGRGV